MIFQESPSFTYSTVMRAAFNFALASSGRPINFIKTKSNRNKMGYIGWSRWELETTVDFERKGDKEKGVRK